MRVHHGAGKQQHGCERHHSCSVRVVKRILVVGSATAREEGARLWMVVVVLSVEVGGCVPESRVLSPPLRTGRDISMRVRLAADRSGASITTARILARAVATAVRNVFAYRYDFDPSRTFCTY